MTDAEHALNRYIAALQDSRFDDAARIANECTLSLETSQLREFDAAAEAALAMLREEFFQELDSVEGSAAGFA